MKKLPLFFLLFFTFLSCVPRKTLKEETDIKKLQENLKKIYHELSTSEVRGRYRYQSQAVTINGRFRMTKKGNEWTVILQNPLSPSLLKINEDTLPIKNLINKDWKEAGLKYEVLGNLLKLNFNDSAFAEIETMDSLPIRIRYNDSLAILSYHNNKLKEIKIQTEDETIILQLDY
ncbi:MAG: hypothetical protein QMD82_00780 [bacterium]|nr:hypothetical protein [bacterium]